MDVFNAYCLGTAGYLTTQALPLLLTPKLIVTMLVAEPRRMTDLEAYLARSLALALLGLAIFSILLSGSIPLTSRPASDSGDSTSPGEGPAGNNLKDPYAVPSVIVTTTYHALSAFYIYTQLGYGGSFAFGAGMVASSTLFCLGVWLIVFGSEKGLISKTTGADKRTGNFPFGNKESAREKKKEAKRKSVVRNGSSRG